MRVCDNCERANTKLVSVRMDYYQQTFKVCKDVVKCNEVRTKLDNQRYPALAEMSLKLGAANEYSTV